MSGNDGSHQSESKSNLNDDEAAENEEKLANWRTGDARMEIPCANWWVVLDATG